MSSVAVLRKFQAPEAAAVLDQRLAHGVGVVLQGRVNSPKIENDHDSAAGLIPDYREVVFAAGDDTRRIHAELRWLIAVKVGHEAGVPVGHTRARTSEILNGAVSLGRGQGPRCHAPMAKIITWPT
jgi:hypothetical protein